LVGLLAAIAICCANPLDAFAQRRQLRDAFNLVAGQSETEEVGPGVQQPFNDDSAASTEPLEALPPPQMFQGRLPLAGSQAGDDMQLSQSRDGRITLKVRDVSLSKILSLLAQAQGLNIVASNDIDAMISITLNDVPVEEALTAILSVANYTWVDRNGIILITSLADSANLPAGVQGRQIQVFELDFASATKVAEAITGFLSPIGKVSVSESDPVDNRMTRELVVVEDLPESLARIAAYICQVDRPPRQVLIEAHVLQVTLTDTTRCGVDFHALCQIAGSDAHIFSVPSLATAQLPVPGATGLLALPDQVNSPASVATFGGHDLQAVIEALQSTTDTKTLGSPKILVLNEQTANVHVGESIGYQTSTTTDVSITQAPQFLDVGVTLRITPRITRDGRVLLHVAPEVSSGAFNAESNAPDKRTSELETDVMLEDGQGMIIGGLIRENDEVTQSKVPYLGDVKGLGWFFRKSEVKKERVEIIFALVPRIQPYNPEYQAYEQGELVKAGVPLMQGPLQRTYRPWDPVLPDGNRVYRRLLPHPNEVKRNWKHGHDAPVYNPWTAEYDVPAHPLPQQRFYDDGCDPSVMSHEALPREVMPPQEGFLSDELEPMMRIRPGSMNGPAIITDQP
jgi:type II secretory pathway component GspD/PulD (secretin)